MSKDTEMRPKPASDNMPNTLGSPLSGSTEHREEVENGLTLLSLPPEIRNMIYKQVFGGINFKITYIRGTRVRMMKVWEDSPADLIGAIWKDDSPARVPATYFDLTTVCRRVHQETSLLPFSLNTFSPGVAMSFVRFASRLTTVQQNAIKSILLNVDFRATDLQNRQQAELFKHKMVPWLSLPERFPPWVSFVKGEVEIEQFGVRVGKPGAAGVVFVTSQIDRLRAVHAGGNMRMMIHKAWLEYSERCVYSIADVENALTSA